MELAWFITLLAMAGVALGALRPAGLPSSALAAFGGGLLVGIAVFWLAPEAVAALGMPTAIAGLLSVAAALFASDHLLGHSNTKSHRILLPLLAASAVHSFIDGWSVRALSMQPVAGIAVPLGVALHKIPEGAALGWLARRILAKTHLAIAAACAVESTTLLGAFVEPVADRSGYAAFGPLWTAAVVTALAGSFVFFGLHAIVPERRNRIAITLFLATFSAAGVLAHFRMAL